MDPWNGSGTTTTVGASKGITTYGLDLNPAMAVIARARLVPTVIQESLAPIAKEIIKASERDTPQTRDIEPLCGWLRRPAATTFRAIQHGIHVVLVPGLMTELDVALDPNQVVQDLPLLACFFYAALFATSRDSLARFRTSNPSWLRYPRSPFERVSPSTTSIHHTFESRVAFLSERLTLSSDTQSLLARIQSGNVLGLKTKTKYGGCVVT